MLKLGITARILCISLISIFFACQSANTNAVNKTRKEVTVDTSITPENAFINYFLDSADVNKFLADAKLSADDSTAISNFYKERNYQFAWFDSSGLTEHASAFVSLYRNYRNVSGDSSLKYKKLDATIDELAQDSNYFKGRKDIVVPTELRLTKQFFTYADKVYAGNSSIDPKELGWFIPRKKLDVTRFLDSVVNSGKGKISGFEPVHPMFTPLHDYLLKYSEISKKGGWPAIDMPAKSYKEGDSSAAIGLLKKHLQMLEDLPASDSGNLFTPTTKVAVIKYQQRHGMEEDGVVGKAMISELNVPVEERIKQLAVNIERIKWIQKPTDGRYIVVNIPAYTLYAFDSGKLQFKMNVVVGDAAHSTVIFSDELETIAFSPYWNVPYSIVKNEMSGKPDAYFERNNMEVVGHYGDGLPQVRQKPGPSNSLGRVKFLFPNSYAIYFHDTPAKSLFDRNKRALSHGCIRLEEPEKMAQWLLRDNPKWTADSIQKMMNLPDEKQVKLDKKVPVFIGYFTAWVDPDGRLNFRDDIYGHDMDMKARLFGK